MPKYELYEVDINHGYKEKFITEDTNLERLKRYSEQIYLYPNESFESSIRIMEDGLPHYQNFSCKDDGTECYPHAIIKLVE
jgi:hypothetical protein